MCGHTRRARSYAIRRVPLLPLLARELGAAPSLVGFVMGASTLTGVFVKLPAGALSDLLGRRRLLLAGAIVFAIMPFRILRCGFDAGSADPAAVSRQRDSHLRPVASASLPISHRRQAAARGWSIARRLRAPVGGPSRGISLRQVVSIWRF